MRQAEDAINDGERKAVLLCDLEPGERLYADSEFLETHLVTDLLSLEVKDRSKDSIFYSA